MAHAEHTVTIDRPETEVFDFIADGTNNRLWRDGVTEISLESGAGVGAVYSQTMKGPGGRQIRGDYRITEFDPPNRLAFAVIAGPARPTGVFQLTADGPSRTQLTFSLDLQAQGFMRLMAPMITSQVRREVAAADNLKRVLEAR